MSSFPKNFYDNETDTVVSDDHGDHDDIDAAIEAAIEAAMEEDEAAIIEAAMEEDDDYRRQEELLHLQEYEERADDPNVLQPSTNLPAGAMPTNKSGKLNQYASKFWFPESRKCTCCGGFRYGCDNCRVGHVMTCQHHECTTAATEVPRSGTVHDIGTGTALVPGTGTALVPGTAIVPGTAPVAVPVAVPVPAIVPGTEYNVTTENIGDITRGTRLHQGRNRRVRTLIRYNGDTGFIFLQDDRGREIKTPLSTANLFWTSY